MAEHRADSRGVLHDERKTVFLVDRSDSFIMYLRILLERMGFRVVPLKKWKLLRELLPILGPDLVLLGTPVEDLAPREALAGLRSDPGGQDVPVVLISPQDEDELGFDCRLAGFAGCLSRPVNIFRLYRLLYDSIVFASGEKRENLRTPFREKVEVTRGGTTSWQRATSLSEGGIFIRTCERMEKGESLSVTVPLGFGHPERLEGVVIYARETLGDAGQGETGVAVRFTSLSEEQTSQLTVCILSLLVGDILEDQEEPVVSLVSRTNSLYEDIVSDHIRLGQDLQRHQLQLKSIMEVLPSGLLILRLRDDGSLEPLSANPAAKRLLGVGSREDLHGAEVSPERWGHGIPAELRRIGREGGSVQMSNVRLVRGEHDDYFDFVLFQAAPGLVAALLSNVTERRKAEEEGFRLQKLESLGYLAGGIAHDFNNLLQLVSGSVDTALALLGNAEEHCPPDKVGRVKYLLGQAQRGVGRATRLSSQLLTFARGGDPLIQSLEIAPVIAEAVEFALHGSDVSCRLELGATLHRVAGDGSQLHQVFTNIVLNAKQAMPRGGELSVAGENVTIGEGHAFLKPGEYVRISVHDTGVGIPENILPNVCDPYFTTKQTGSGLGLSNALSIVHKHGGWMDIESRVGFGTTVHIYLPVPAAEPEDAARKESGGAPRGGRVLVMDDEEELWPVAREMLELLGFDAVCVRNGQDMLRVFVEAREAGKNFDVVIMDLTVRGGMGGEEAIRELLKVAPEAKAVVSSGYADAPILARFRDFGFRAALPKPFSHRVLALVLEEILG